MGFFDWFRRGRSPAPMTSEVGTLVLRSSRYFLDGGTTVLHSVDADGRERAVMLVQHFFPESGGLGIVGRLHLDGRPVPVRSDLERRILAALREAEVRPIPPTERATERRIRVSPNALVLGDDIKRVMTRGPEENLRALRDEVVQRVESAEYVSFAEKVDQR